ncbi:CRISPR-associated endoribonuclease Cas6 [Emticicia sp. 17c]|uniref:CRISPR-associated endoribonuclease Cas6 n=1 Tax=Emticicia sp. 17c TaxID=3127704 RepID=UPI00301C6B7F
MRLHIHLSRNKEVVPFNYQERQVSKLHYWLGKNEIHNKQSLYSFSWLKNGEQRGEKGLMFTNGSQYFISCFDNNLIKQIIKSIQADNDFGWGMKIISLSLEKEPTFNTEHSFSVGSPVFIKRLQLESKNSKFYFYNDIEANLFLTQTLTNKLKQAGLPSSDIEVRFDESFPNPHIKGCMYKGVKNKGSICPIIIKGTPEQLAFAWNVGVGNSTGIGFGSLI